MTLVYGYYRTAADEPETGAVTLTPYLTVPNDDPQVRLVTGKKVVARLDADGYMEMEVIPSDDLGWRTGGASVPYLVEERLEGATRERLVFVLGSVPVDINLLPNETVDTGGPVETPVPGPAGPGAAAGGDAGDLLTKLSGDDHDTGWVARATVLQPALDHADAQDDAHSAADRAYTDAGLAGKSDTSHNHDGDYAAASHNHDGSYAAASHQHTEADITDLGAYVTDAPSDGKQYARQDGGWSEVAATGGGLMEPSDGLVVAQRGSGGFDLAAAIGTNVTAREIFGTPYEVGEAGTAGIEALGNFTVYDPYSPENTIFEVVPDPSVNVYGMLRVFDYYNRETPAAEFGNGNAEFTGDLWVGGTYPQAFNWDGVRIGTTDGRKLVTNLDDPVSAEDAASKNYVDSRTPPVLVLGAADPVPPGTAAGTVIVRTEA